MAAGASYSPLFGFLFNCGRMTLPRLVGAEYVVLDVRGSITVCWVGVSCTRCFTAFLFVLGGRCTVSTDDLDFGLSLGVDCASTTDNCGAGVSSAMRVLWIIVSVKRGSDELPSFNSF